MALMGKEVATCIFAMLIRAQRTSCNDTAGGFWFEISHPFMTIVYDVPSNFGAIFTDGSGNMELVDFHQSRVVVEFNFMEGFFVSGTSAVICSAACAFTPPDMNTKNAVSLKLYSNKDNNI